MAEKGIGAWPLSAGLIQKVVQHLRFVSLDVAGSVDSGGVHPVLILSSGFAEIVRLNTHRHPPPNHLLVWRTKGFDRKLC
jgi:hypothetical protein